MCLNNYPKLLNNNVDFDLNNETKSLYLQLENNELFNPNKKEDLDND
jgi:hypothetical protein